MMKQRYAALNLVLNTVLLVIAAIVYHPGVRERYNIIFVTDLAEKVTACGKETYMIAIHNINLKPVLTCYSIFAPKNTHISFNMKDHTVTVNVSVNEL